MRFQTSPEVFHHRLHNHVVREVAFASNGDAIIATSHVLFRCSHDLGTIEPIEKPVTDFGAVAVSDRWIWAASTLGLCGWDDDR